MKPTRLTRAFFKEKGIHLALLAVWLVWGVSMLTGCATPEHTVKEIETQNVDVKGSTVDGGKIAITEKGQAIIQVEKTVEDELRVQDLVNMHFQDNLRSELFHLNDCRTKRADPSNGGSGELEPMPAVDHFRFPEPTEEMGVTEDGGLKLVSREFLDEKLKTLRKYQKSLETLVETVKPLREECERKLGYTLAGRR